MSDARLMYEWEEIQADQATKSDARHTPILAKDVKNKNLVQLLADAVLAWPTRDLRLEHQYNDTRDVEPTDSAFMSDVAHNMTTCLRKKDLKQGMLTVDVLFQTNMAEFERYNLTVQQHNEEWTDMGGNMDVFDPKTGDIHPVRDNYVAQAIAHADKGYVPETLIEDTSTGPLAQARPTVKRSVGVTVEYRVSLDGAIFKLEYVAKDMKGRVLYFNVDESSDLTVLVRHSVQGLWGNHDLYGDEGAYLDGIAQLYQGLKAAHCEFKPSFLTGHLKDTTIERVASQATRGTINFAIPILAYWVPCILTWLVISGFFNALCAMEYNSRWVWYPISPTPIHADNIFMSCVIIETILFTTMWVSTMIAGHLARKESALQMREKFI